MGERKIQSRKESVHLLAVTARAEPVQGPKQELPPVSRPGAGPQDFSDSVPLSQVC